MFDNIRARISRLFSRPVAVPIAAPKKRFYEAAGIGRLTSDWEAALNFSSDYEVFRDKNLTMARSRDLAMNNDYVRKYLRLMATNVVGDAGVTLKPDIRFPNGKHDDLANRIVLAAWNEWCMRGNCTADGAMSFPDFQRLIIQSTARDGEAFIHQLSGFSNKWGFAIKPIEPEYFDIYYNTLTGDETQILKNNYIRMSIEYDQNGRAVAYWPHRTYPQDFLYAVSPLGNDRVRIPAENMVHVYMKERASMTRGMPFYVSAMVRLKMLKGYEETCLVAARVAAFA